MFIVLTFSNFCSISFVFCFSDSVRLSVKVGGLSSVAICYIFCHLSLPVLNRPLGCNLPITDI